MGNILFNDFEYPLYGFKEDVASDFYSEDIREVYLHEIMKYPLLEEEEEKRLGEMILNPYGKKLLVFKKINKNVSFDINIPLLFNSLCDNFSYQEILESLLRFYGRLNTNNDNTVTLIQKYLKEAKKVNRSLNKEELLRLFDINEEESLNHLELIYELKSFMDYKYAFEKLFFSNLRLVYSIASKYYDNDSFMDAINEGNIGLLKAILRYDVTLGNKFDTYAWRWIKTQVQREIMGSTRTVVVPEGFYFEAIKFKNKVKELEKETGRTYSINELSQIYNVPIETVRLYYFSIQDDISLNTKIGKNGEFEVYGFMKSDDSTEEDSYREMLKEDIEKLFFSLSEREIMVVKMTYGIGEYAGNEMSSYKIADILHLSRSRVSNILNNAMVKMKLQSKHNREVAAMEEYTR